ncbi:MAG: phosphoenolpyruvate synthase [Patescibacteria group bacterium]|nr:phosphoenolpyruvate synthase [Patescibacteria group bacterium]MDD4304046.1 phosphoenolpyruvate synthase [Patescibacteria group bacterium]MDD4694923.1 phosphoenolpyruvate synthase [Patescibacteria group bacterium]
MNRSLKNVLWFDEISIKDVSIVGGKNASLGEMYKNLKKKGVPVPYGFAITANAYKYFLKSNNIDKKIKDVLKGLDTGNISDLKKRAKEIREIILKAEFPEDLNEEILKAYLSLAKFYKKTPINLDVAVRSSATAEDLPDASFAGQQESYLNITGEYALLESVKRCMASLFTDRAISYRVDKKFDHMKIALSVTVQKMVRSDLASSGVMFSIDTESGFPDIVVINASYGLGEYVVKGVVNPDEYYIYKPTLKKKFNSIIGKDVGDKTKKLIYATGGTNSTQNVDVALNERLKFVLKENEIIKLANWAVIIENHYKKPMDMEWAKDGKTGELFIVQARPETVASQENRSILIEYFIKQCPKPILVGQSVGKKIGQGISHVIKNVDELSNFKEREVLVAEMTDPDWEPVMKKASAIVTNSGGRTCHAAIVSRELGIPCVVGTKNAMSKLKNGQKITVDCSLGEEGYVYDGIIPFITKKTNLKNLKLPKNVKIMMNVGNPRQAFRDSMLPNDGVGLARQEFIISNYIKVHPLALLNFSQVKDKSEKEIINNLTVNYKSKPDFYVEKLAEGVAKIASAFYPKDVIIRLSDFKSNEYANLIGGKYFEPVEDNPMIGWRGASRYYDPKYEPAFRLECKALKKVRDNMGLTNVKIMIPFCRTIEEGKKVIKIMETEGLKRGVNSLELYVMCEIPSNVILANEFCKIFDGFSIGSNDLTQLTLGVDRDSSVVSHIYDERNEAVKELIRQVIRIAKKNKRKVGICGQAPSDFPDFAKFLVKEHIDSMSLVPDSVVNTILQLKKMR